MIDGEAALLDIAKVAIAVTGFTGVVVTFRHPREALWKANEVEGLKLLLWHSLGAVLFGLLPSIAYLRWSDQSLVWLGGSALLGAFLAWQLLSNIAAVQRASARGYPPRAMKQMLIEYFPFTLVALYLQVQNAISWRASFGYTLGCLWLLIAASRQFSIFLMDVKVDQGTPAKQPGK